MKFLTLFFLSWIVFFIFSDRKRWKQLHPTSLLAIALGLFSDCLIYNYRLWEYKDEPFSLLSISLLLNLGIYPVYSFLFIQNLPGLSIKKIPYFFIWSLIAISLEKYFTHTGKMLYHMWWNGWFSYAADWLLLFVFYFHYLWYNSGFDKAKHRAI